MTKLVIAALPFLVFLVVGRAMSVAVGRPAALRNSNPANPKPLNMRFRYGVDDIDAFWRALGPSGVQVERRFLVYDLTFPLFYGGALVFALWWLCRAAGWNAGLTIAPVVVGGVADWVENLVHLNLLSRYVRGGKTALPEAVVSAASAATAVKLAGVALGFLLVVIVTVAALSKKTA
jgi:hypothetical protein